MQQLRCCTDYVMMTYAMMTSILTSVDETTIQLVADLDTNTGAVVLKKPDHGKCIFMN